MYIALEGHDGSGKSSTGEILRSRLSSTGKDVLYIRAPGTTSFGQYVRHQWHPNEKVRALQFLANHVEIVEDIVIPHLDRGGLVIQDRTFLSGIVYQGWLGKIQVDFLSNMCARLISRRPDYLFVFECDSKNAVTRTSSLQKDLKDFSESDTATIKALYRVEADAWDGIVVDTDQDQEKVVNFCMEIIGQEIIA